VAFSCSICEQESTRICASCTKDACDNHLCDQCGFCSDCCECDVPLNGPAAHVHAATPPQPSHVDPPPESDWPPATVPPHEAFSIAPEEPDDDPLENPGV
jgi:hypothetical protein